MIKQFLKNVLAWLGILGCAIIPPAGTALEEVPFKITPHIMKKGSQYYLRYQIAIEEEGHLQLKLVLYSKKTNDRGYYYFGIPMSHSEFGNLVERPLAIDGLVEFAEKDSMYWLNPDGSEIHLEIREETEL